MAVEDPKPKENELDNDYAKLQICEADIGELLSQIHS
jgi:hypothetical protein